MPRRPANPYRMSEKRRILQFIIEHKAYYQVKGNSLWIKMESEFEGAHTWQSLKEHYKKQLLPNLRSADLKLTQAQIINFQQGFGGILNKKKKEHVRRNSPVSFYKLWSDDDTPLAVSSVNENSRSTEVLRDEPGPSVSSNSNEIQKEKIPVSSKNNSSQVPDSESMNTTTPIACSNDNLENQHETSDSQTLAGDVDSDVTNITIEEYDDSLTLE